MKCHLSKGIEKIIKLFSKTSHIAIRRKSNCNNLCVLLSQIVYMSIWGVCSRAHIHVYR